MGRDAPKSTGKVDAGSGEDGCLGKDLDPGDKLHDLSQGTLGCVRGRGHRCEVCKRLEMWDEEGTE